MITSFGIGASKHAVLLTSKCFYISETRQVFNLTGAWNRLENDGNQDIAKYGKSLHVVHTRAVTYA